MKAIIDGKRYNTETATQVASYSNGFGGRDFRAYSEDLFITKNGRWFLDGEGGPMTKYAESCGDSTCGGRRIIPLSADEAYKWLQDKGEAIALEKHFATMIEDA